MIAPQPDNTPTVALIHATPAALQPARDAFGARFPQARLWNLLDDQLLAEAQDAGHVTPALRERMRNLIRYAVDGGADAVLLTCSMYGPVAADAAVQYPQSILASDQALFAAVAAQAARPGGGRVAVLGPIPAGVDDTVARLRDHLATTGAGVTALTGTVVDGAPDAAATGNQARLEKLVVDATRRAATDADVVVIGQFSLSPAQPAAQAAVDIPVLSPPHLAADVLREHLGVRTPA